MRGGGERREGKEGRGGKARRGEERTGLTENGTLALGSCSRKKEEKKSQGCLCKVMVSKRVQMSVPVISEEQQSPGWETSEQ